MAAELRVQVRAKRDDLMLQIVVPAKAGTHRRGLAFAEGR